MTASTAATDPFAGVEIVQTATRPMAAPATAPQLAFIAKLEAERNFTMPEGAGETKADASKWIDQLLAMPKKAATPHVEPPEGFHEIDGVVYKVQRAVHGSGNLYAKVLISGGGWDYVGRKPLGKLSEKTVLTLERAKELGKLYGVCCRCGLTLTKEEIIAAGIGPVCASKF